MSKPNLNSSIQASRAGLGTSSVTYSPLRHGDLSVPGDPGTGRVQVYIEVESFPPSATQDRAEVFSANVWPPTFELIDDGTGKTVLFGLLLPAIQKVTDKDGR